MKIYLLLKLLKFKILSRMSESVMPLNLLCSKIAYEE